MHVQKIVKKNRMCKHGFKRLAASHRKSSIKIARVNTALNDLQQQPDLLKLP